MGDKILPQGPPTSLYFPELAPASRGLPQWMHFFPSKAPEKASKETFYFFTQGPVLSTLSKTPFTEDDHEIKTLEKR